jgi:hypothetical protein
MRWGYKIMTAIKIPILSTERGTYKQKDLFHNGLSPFVLSLNGLHSQSFRQIYVIIYPITYYDRLIS